MKNLSLLFFLLFFSSFPIIGQIINVPGDQLTIQAGINAAQNGGIQDSNVTLLGTWTSGYCEDVCIVGDFAYILKGSVFEILDITNPTIPIPVGQVILKYNPYQILVSNNYAYVMRAQYGWNTFYGYYIIDISDQGNPIEIGFYQLGGNVCRFIDVRGDYIFVVNTVWSAVDHSSLQVIDVSDPKNPIAIGNSDDFVGEATDISVSGNMAYILTRSYNDGKSRVYKFDISIPTNPQIIAEYDTGINGAYDLSISENYGFIINSSELHIFNTDDFTIQNSIGYYNFGNYHNIEEVYKRDNYLYVAITQMDAADIRLRHLNIRILDISDPSNPVETGSYSKLLTGYWVETMEVSDNYAYITLGPDGLNIFDISDISNPSYAGNYHTGGGVGHFSATENYVYVENGQFGGISVIDCEQPENLNMVNYIPTEIEDARFIVADNYLYMIKNVGSSSYFSIFGIDSTTELEEIGSYKINQRIANFQIANNFAYLILGNGELLILDIAHPENIEEISRTPIFDYGTAICISDNIAYIGVSWGAWGTYFALLSRVDITNLSNPEILDTLSIAYGGTNKIVVSNNFAYLIGSWSDWEGYNSGKWFYIIDYANPSEPQVVDSFDWDVRDIDINEDVAYLTTDEGLEIFDITDPYELKKIGFYDINSARDVLINEDIIYVSSPSVLYSFKSGFSTDLENKTEIISTFLLSQNYPNPFNPNTTIKFALPSPGFVTLSVFNILGEQVATLVSENLITGSYKYEWDATELTSGIYFYRIQAGTFVETKKMVLMK